MPDMAVNDVTHQLKLLTDSALKLLPQCSGSKYIKKSNSAHTSGYDKKGFSARKEYHKARNKHNKHNSVATRNTMIEKSKKY